MAEPTRAELRNPETVHGGLVGILTEYFNANSVLPVKNPMDRVLGFTFQVSISSWPGNVQIGPEHLGLDEEEFGKLDESLSFGHFRLLPKQMQSNINAVTRQLRACPEHFGIASPWGAFVHLQAAEKFRDQFSRLEAEFYAVVESLIERRDELQADAYNRALEVANASARNAASRGVSIDPEEMALRLTEKFRSASAIRESFSVRLDSKYIGRPELDLDHAHQIQQLKEAQAAALQQQRTKLERDSFVSQAEYLEAMNRLSKAEQIARVEQQAAREHRERLEQRFKQQEQELLEFYYVHIARTLRESVLRSVNYLREALSGSSKISPAAGRSMTTMLEQVRAQLLPDDVELGKIIAQLETQKNSEYRGYKFDPSPLDDLALLLESGIIAMGGEVRQRQSRSDLFVTPEVAKIEDYRDMVKNARRQVGIREGESLAEITLEKAGITMETVRKRRVVEPDPVSDEASTRKRVRIQSPVSTEEREDMFAVG